MFSFINSNFTLARGKKTSASTSGCHLTNLKPLARHRGEVVPRDVLEAAIRQEGSAHVSNVVDVLILRLRRKLGRDLITTRRGQGFLIEWQDGRG